MADLPYTPEIDMKSKMDLFPEFINLIASKKIQVPLKTIMQFYREEYRVIQAGMYRRVYLADKLIKRTAQQRKQITNLKKIVRSKDKLLNNISRSIKDGQFYARKK